MKFTAERKYLAQAVGRAALATSNRNTLPILSNVLVQTVGNDRLQVTGSDLDVYIRATCPASVEVQDDEGLAIPAGKLADILAKFSNDVVAVETEDSTATLRCGRSKIIVSCTPGSDYPVVPDMPHEVSRLTLGQPELKAALSRVAFCAEKSDVLRTLLAGVCFEVKGTSLTLIATDTKRLAALNVALEGEVQAASVVINNLSLQRLSKLLAGTESVTLSFGTRLKDDAPNMAVIDYGDCVLTTRLVDGIFPNWEKVIPTEYQTTIGIDRAAFHAALSRVMVAAGDLNESRARFEARDGALTIISENPDGVSVNDVVAIDLDGPEITFATNARQFTEALAAQAERCTMRLSTPLRPILLEDDAYRYVQMPMQV